MWSSARSEGALRSELPVDIEVRPIRGARRMRLRFDDTRGVLKLTCPLKTSRTKALAWALDQRDWIDAQLARALPPEPFVPGALIPVAGLQMRLAWEADLPRSPVMVGEEIRSGGPEAGFERRIEAFLRRLALETMSAEATDFAAAAGVTPKSISIGDAAMRWGSCSSDNRIRLSWRLILASPQARRYVVAHEVAHLKHLNHGPEFKALEARVFGPGIAAAKAALRREGPRLRRIGRRI